MRATVSDVELVVRKCFGDVLAGRLQDPVLVAFVKRLLDGGVLPKSINSVRQLLREFALLVEIVGLYEFSARLFPANAKEKKKRKVSLKAARACGDRTTSSALSRSSL